LNQNQKTSCYCWRRYWSWIINISLL